MPFRHHDICRIYAGHNNYRCVVVDDGGSAAVADHHAAAVDGSGEHEIFIAFGNGIVHGVCTHQYRTLSWVDGEGLAFGGALPGLAAVQAVLKGAGFVVCTQSGRAQAGRAEGQAQGASQCCAGDVHAKDGVVSFVHGDVA